MAGVDRGVSTVVGYVLNIGIATILITGLLLSGASLVSDQRDRTVRTELDVLGNRLAADLETADRLLRLGDGEVTVRTALPDRVAGTEYHIEIQTTAGTVEIRLETADSSITRTVPVRNTSRIKAGTVDGGDVVIDGAAGWLEVSDG